MNNFFTKQRSSKWAVVLIATLLIFIVLSLLFGAIRNEITLRKYGVNGYGRISEELSPGHYGVVVVQPSELNNKLFTDDADYPAGSYKLGEQVDIVVAPRGNGVIGYIASPNHTSRLAKTLKPLVITCVLLLVLGIAATQKKKDPLEGLNDIPTRRFGM